MPMTHFAVFDIVLAFNRHSPHGGITITYYGVTNYEIEGGKSNKVIRYRTQMK
jgi:hypothetical protein